MVRALSRVQPHRITRLVNKTTLRTPATIALRNHCWTYRMCPFLPLCSIRPRWRNMMQGRRSTTINPLNKRPKKSGVPAMDPALNRQGKKRHARFVHAPTKPKHKSVEEQERKDAMDPTHEATGRMEELILGPQNPLENADHTPDRYVLICRIINRSWAIFGTKIGPPPQPQYPGEESMHV
ncbi:hypothetical protein Salat_0875600 [Sesamum alatum]|uniref:Uncharacterized protein n=1 Tax=Sesamum alatum TaxID=300844 RepID=A0AAE2CQT7_9LAMI|nr:hypothetical protein Salat_0875600 [Sesamum alatum]